LAGECGEKNPLKIR